MLGSGIRSSSLSKIEFPRGKGRHPMRDNAPRRSLTAPVDGNRSSIAMSRHDEAPRKAPKTKRKQSSGEERARRLRRFARFPFFSKLTLRVLAINVLALCVPVAGFLYMGQLEEELVQTELENLKVEGTIAAAALAEGAVIATPESLSSIDGETARQLVRRIYQTTASRTRLFAADGRLLADSRLLAGPGGIVEVELLTEEEPVSPMQIRMNRIYDAIFSLMPPRNTGPLYIESADQNAQAYPIVLQALGGTVSTQVWSDGEGGRILGVAIPVQQLRAVLGTVMLTRDDRSVEDAMRSVRTDVILIFAAAMLVTILLSFYLSGTLTRPIRRLALAADQVRRGQGRKHEIPDFSLRSDEIGDLSGALREMTEALWTRMDAIERFAADVSHEIKNPLTSLRSAVETIARITDPDQQKRLMSIILEDVQRLDRLITDISDASRLDAELSRAAVEPVDIAYMLQTLGELNQSICDERGIRLSMQVPPAGSAGMQVPGLETRLVQVFRNLIANAISFSPEGGRLTVSATSLPSCVEVIVADEGPGIPPGKLAAIFDRFYSERPKDEKFGTHSGLGLSISHQIVQAHDGEIFAANRDGGPGAIFTVRIPR